MTRTATHSDGPTVNTVLKGILILAIGILIGITLPNMRLPDFFELPREQAAPILEDWHGNVRRSHY